MGGEGDGGERPLFLVGRVVGQEPAGEVYRGGVGIVEFDPVGEGPVVVRESRGVGRHEFGDQRGGGGRRGQAGEQGEREGQEGCEPGDGRAGGAGGAGGAGQAGRSCRADARRGGGRKRRSGRAAWRSDVRHGKTRDGSTVGEVYGEKGGISVRRVTGVGEAGKGGGQRNGGRLDGPGGWRVGPATARPAVTRARWGRAAARRVGTEEKQTATPARQTAMV